MLLGFPHRFERDHPSPEMVPFAIKFLPGAPDEMDVFVNLDFECAVPRISRDLAALQFAILLFPIFSGSPTSELRIRVPERYSSIAATRPGVL
jgi:hypothetical protein